VLCSSPEFGVGAGLTLDELALWLHLKDVYWAEKGRRSFAAVVVAARGRADPARSEAAQRRRHEIGRRARSGPVGHQCAAHRCAAQGIRMLGIAGLMFIALLSCALPDRVAVRALALSGGP